MKNVHGRNQLFMMLAVALASLFVVALVAGMDGQSRAGDTMTEKKTEQASGSQATAKSSASSRAAGSASAKSSASASASSSASARSGGKAGAGECEATSSATAEIRDSEGRVIARDSDHQTRRGSGCPAEAASSAEAGVSDEKE